MDTWVIIVGLAMLMIGGSVAWIMPSKRDRRIAKLRQYALNQQIKIKLMTYPAINESGRVQEQAVSGAEYRFSLPDLIIHGPGWMLIRSQFDAQKELSEANGINAGWDWYVNSQPLSDAILVHINHLTGYCKESLLSISMMGSVIGIGWDESGNQDDIAFFIAWADQLSTLLVESLSDETIKIVADS